MYEGGFSLEFVMSAVGQSRWSGSQGIDALAGEQDRVSGGLGELLNAGGDVDGVADQSEFELACAAYGAGAKRQIRHLMQGQPMDCPTGPE